jgi:hypothetical protein
MQSFKVGGAMTLNAYKITKFWRESFKAKENFVTKAWTMIYGKKRLRQEDA